MADNLSKVGMSLEKMLAYIYTKNKSIKDETVPVSKGLPATTSPMVTELDVLPKI